MPCPPAPRPSSTSARRPSGSRAICPAPSTSARATSSSRSRAPRPTATAQVVLYCAGGVRSLFAAQTLAEIGYTNVASMSGGFQAVEGRRAATCEAPVVLTAEQKQRYSRHLLIPEVGVGGPGEAARLEGAAHRRRRPRLARRRSTSPPPASGTIGIVDFDVVDVSNLQRQIVHTTDRVGERKVESAPQDDQGAQPRRQGRRPRGDARRRQRRADHRRLRRHPRRHRHVRDALHRSTTRRSRPASRSSTPASSGSRAS